MTKRQFLFCVSLLACCLVTNRLTWWLVRAHVRSDFHEAVNAHQYVPTFDAFLAVHPLKDGEQVNGDNLPPSLAAFGIVNVYRNGQFVYFVLPSTSFLPDSATSEFIRQLDNKGGAIETILSTTKRNTYHIQFINSAPGWYFWLHN